jgi:pimeloyl-ACP methyl ester carboxylesterase
MTFTPAHRGGSGTPLVLLHGFTDTWRTWELVLPSLERRHEVLAPTLPGHAAGPPLVTATDAELADAVEHAMDEAGFERAHLVGNSLGGYIAFLLAERGRAESVVALAPSGGWAVGDESYRETLDFFSTMHEQVQAAAPHADAIAASPNGRRRATEFITTRYEHIPPELVAHQIAGAAGCEGTPALVDSALRDGWNVEPARIDAPVRIVWGTDDRLLEWPRAAARYRQDWFPHADWVELEGVGHCPQLDVPLETAQLILEFTGR